jgi:cellulose biosynthesis protein BcsQ
MSSKPQSAEVHGITVQKGGVGKSTYSHALAYAFAIQGLKTLIIDVDPQATLTGAFFGFRGEDTFGGDNVSNITNIYKKRRVEPIKIKTTKFIENPNKGKMHQPHYLEEEIEIDFIPANSELLEIMEGDDFKYTEKIDVIVNFVESLRDKYDKIILDAPPSFGIITKAILKSSDSIIVPIPTKNVDTDGMVGFFYKLDKLFADNKEIRLKKAIVVPSMFDKRVKDSKQTLHSIKLIPNFLQNTKCLRNLKCTVLEPFPQKSCVQEAPSFNMFLAHYIMDYDRSNMDLILKINKIAKELSDLKAVN